ncbi:AAA family ATPase [Novosphingobium sp. Fuku2-ISO-50]|uniref:AAA family ATPase n=1 Tax=Novosphingobium sp. Fuku2-ISO-50 TaxID=1739114 RepID=UPI00076D568D|nr:AAA family ATPase [Novosphingobium sp. Fuku2-ISO-50]KUR74796.1 hypothetical protein AQZ50_17250 [Novosphingobium sp. Fuku2-ISO-50]
MIPDNGLAGRIEAVAKRLFGEPNRRQSKDGELRFGSHGSLRVTIAGDHRGTWRDHETGHGGGVLDLIAHKLGGDRKAAAAWFRDNFESDAAANDPGREVAVYRYEDWAGELVHEVVRYEPKSFRQRRPDGKGGYLWNMKGVRPTLYNLPRVTDAAVRSDLVFVVEGEKDADRLNRLGLVATCNAGGAGKWKPEHSSQLAGARVAIVPDNDEAGTEHALQIAQALRGHSSDLRLVELGLADRKADISDWLDGGGTAGQLLAIVAEAQQWRPVFKSRFPLVWFGQEDAGEPLRWLLRGLLVEGGLSVFFGAPKSTKTFAALDLALHLAHGRDWFGLRSRRCGIAYICGEGAAGVRQRMKAWRQERDGDPRAPFALIPQSINMFDDPDELDRLIADIRGIAEPMNAPVGLVVLDTLSRMIGGGDEDKARDVNVVVRNAERIQRLTGAHVLIVHHSGKDRDRGMRGSNALLGAVDAAIEVTKDADTGLCEAKVVAIKDGGEVGPFSYTLAQTAVGTDDDGEPMVSCVIDPAGARPGGKRPSLSDAERRALKVLRELAGDSRDIAGQTARVPVGTWRDAFRDREDGAFDARKKRAARATKGLIDKGLVEAGYDLVWLVESEL